MIAGNIWGPEGCCYFGGRQCCTQQRLLKYILHVLLVEKENTHQDSRKEPKMYKTWLPQLKGLVSQQSVCKRIV